MELPLAVTIFIASLFGAIIGSFLNVLILRTISGKSLSGRSACPHCRKTLSAIDLVPIFSFVFLRGSCRQCHAPISYQYPLVEATTAIAFALIACHTNPFGSLYQALYFALYAAFASLSIAIAVIDFKTTIIPDRLSGTLAIVSIAIAVLKGIEHQDLLMQLLAGPMLALPFALLWLVSRGRWIGLGDAKYVISMGWLLGLSKGATAVMLAFWIGAAVSVGLIGIAKFVAWQSKRVVNSGALLGRKKRLTIKSEVPFAPFLILATALVAVSGFNLLGLLM